MKPEGNRARRRLPGLDGRAARAYDRATMSSGTPPIDPSLTRMQARPENTRHIRHAELMRRWPVLAEDWARRIDTASRARAGAASREPGPPIR